MTEEHARVYEAIMILNEVNQVEPDVLAQMMTTRYLIGQSLDSHPTMQVSMPAGHTLESGLRELGPLGLINGLLGRDPEREGGLIYMCYCGESKLILHFFSSNDLDQHKNCCDL